MDALELWHLFLTDAEIEAGNRRLLADLALDHGTTAGQCSTRESKTVGDPDDGK